MSGHPLTRRHFTFAAAAALAAPRLRAQTGTRADVAAIEHDHILASLKQVPAEPPPPTLETLRRDTAHAAALTAAFVLTHDDIYATRAAAHIDRWLATSDSPLTSLAPLSTRDDIVHFIPLAELARCTSFLPDTTSEAPTARAHTMTSVLDFLNNDPQAKLARDTKDHRASAWLLIAAALARATRDEKQLDQLRLRFKKPTLRNQITADGHCPQEIATDNPYRNSLFNFDLLAGACQLLTSPFDDLWHYELPDGPGLHSVAAFLYPLIREPRHWPFLADAQNFHDLPGRRPALLFTGRAYDRAEYIDLYRTLPFTPPPDAIAYSFPITQPLLFTARAPHGL